MVIKLLDLFCGGGGCAVGYKRAANELGISIQISGIDIKPIKHYPFGFSQANAMHFLDTNWIISNGFTHIHASPPCQLFSRSTASKADRSEYPDLLTPVLEFLRQSPVPSVTENVMPAPLRGDIILNGQMFGLKVIRERKFELNGWFCMQPGKGQIKKNSVVNGDLMTVTSKGIYRKKITNRFTHIPGKTLLDKQRHSMGIDWMNQKELGQAIPPAYTHYIGLQWFSMLLNR